MLHGVRRKITSIREAILRAVAIPGFVLLPYPGIASVAIATFAMTAN